MSFQISQRCSKAEPRAVGKHRNSNVSNILPLATEGGRISGHLFSIFCAETRVLIDSTDGVTPMFPRLCL
jgi:hypothetical protein